MRKFSLLVMVLAVGSFALGCGSSGDKAEEGSAKADVDQATDMAMGTVEAMPAASMEIACGGCIYHMAGVETCTPAIKVGDKTMLLTGVVVDAHGLGLCETSRMAMVAGKVDGDHFVATKVELE